MPLRLPGFITKKNKNKKKRLQVISLVFGHKGKVDGALCMGELLALNALHRESISLTTLLNKANKGRRFSSQQDL